MKITTKQYAKALLELTKDKREDEIDSIVLKFSKELKRQKKLKDADEILDRFSEIYNKESGIIEVEIISAREINDDQVDKIKSFIKDKYEAKKVMITKKIDEEIKGGIILKIGDEVIDGSISKKLKNLNLALKK